MSILGKIYCALTAGDLWEAFEKYDGLCGYFEHDVRHAKIARDCLFNAQRAENVAFGRVCIAAAYETVPDGNVFYLKGGSTVAYCYFIPCCKAYNAEAYLAWLDGKEVCGSDGSTYVVGCDADPDFFEDTLTVVKYTADRA